MAGMNIHLRVVKPADPFDHPSHCVLHREESTVGRAQEGAIWSLPVVDLLRQRSAHIHAFTTDTMSGPPCTAPAAPGQATAAGQAVEAIAYHRPAHAHLQRLQHLELRLRQAGDHPDHPVDGAKQHSGDAAQLCAPRGWGGGGWGGARHVLKTLGLLDAAHYLAGSPVGAGHAL